MIKRPSGHPICTTGMCALSCLIRTDFWNGKARHQIQPLLRVHHELPWIWQKFQMREVIWRTLLLSSVSWHFGKSQTNGIYKGSCFKVFVKGGLKPTDFQICFWQHPKCWMRGAFVEKGHSTKFWASSLVMKIHSRYCRLYLCPASASKCALRAAQHHNRRDIAAKHGAAARKTAEKSKDAEPHSDQAILKASKAK